MINAENLYFSYSGGEPYVLSDLNFQAPSGAYVSILGENGSGKSTLIKLLLGLIKPNRGTIKLETKNCAYVPQMTDFADSRFPISVREMLDSYRRLLKIKSRDRTKEVLDAVGMQKASEKLIGNLSGGQKQKIFLARALMGSPELLVLDEPSAGVDVKSRQEIYAYLKQLNSVQGITILSVEHNLEAALRNSTAIYHMAGGRGHICDPKTYAREYLSVSEGIF